MTKMTGAQALIASLEHEGVDVVFGVPGGAILPAYDPLLDSPIRHVLARHEQGAGHMAEGYAWATGRVGVCIATSGPGATNLVTPLADALMDSVPIVAITGQVPTSAVGNDAFQEAYTTGITMPATKHNYFVTDPGEITDVIHEAFHIASTGRPGPVLVDLPKDILNQSTTWHRPNDLALPGYKPTFDGHPRRIKEAVEMIYKAKRPVLYVGGGVIKANGAEALKKLAEATGIPVTTTLMGRGAFPDSHPLAMGMPGMHGTYTAITSIQKADLLIAVGVRFDDRVTGNPKFFAPHAKVIHIDVDPAEIGKVRFADIPIVGDAGRILSPAARGMGRTRDAGPKRLARDNRPLEDRVSASLSADSRRSDQTAVCHRGALPLDRRRRHDRGRRRPAPDVGEPVLEVRGPEAVDQLGWARNDGISPFPPRSVPRPALRTSWSSPSMVTAAFR